MDRTELLARLRRARSEAAAGGRGDTVLDRLIADEPDPASLCLALEQHTGVGAVWDVGVASAALDWAAIPSARLKGFVGLPFRPGPGQPVRIGVEDPWDDTVLHKLTGALGRVPLLVAVSSTVWAACREASELSASDHGEAAAAADQAGNAPPFTTELPSSSVVAFVDAAIAQAIDRSASDIHFECDRHGVAVKFRQDGVLTAWQRLESSKRAEEVVSRIKVLAQLDITERRVPQDGRFRWQGAGAGGIDLRVSIMPSIHGEDAVLRLLDKAQLRNADPSRSLNALGFDTSQAQRIRDLVTLPHGMLLVTGPTGSGKTTTVYAALSESNTGLEKIVTIEDPVEYELPGVLQIPVNERKGLTFAKGLRSILRHDPDRILVGEIRDAETAEIAVQSALTGHQVFTTVHANSIFDVVGRFRHFGLDMFGFMSSLNGVIVQRLLRRLCTACAADRATTAAEQTWLAAHATVPSQASARLWRAVGCSECRNTGYRGRRVVAEVHAIDDRLRDLVTAGASMSALREHVEHLASTTLLRQGRTSQLRGQRPSRKSAVSSVGSSPAANLFVGTRSIALETADGVMRMPMEEPLQEIVKAMSQVPRQRWRRPAIRVWLSGGLCRAFLLEVAEGLNDEEEVRLLAAGVAPARTGFGSACRVWVEPARARKSLVVVAMEESVAQRITSASESAGVALVGMSAWWSAPQRALCRRLPVGSRPVLLVQDEDSLTVLRGDGDTGFEDALTWFPVVDHESAGALRQRWEIDGTPWLARLDLEAAPEGAQDERFAFDRWTRVSP